MASVFYPDAVYNFLNAHCRRVEKLSRAFQLEQVEVMRGRCTRLSFEEVVESRLREAGRAGKLSEGQPLMGRVSNMMLSKI